ncbi:MAG: hypothetical protein IJ867_06050 [Clostridia bacterium]|nr:hypothetical protein [Clostridia bacterium]
MDCNNYIVTIVSNSQGRAISTIRYFYKNGNIVKTNSGYSTREFGSDFFPAAINHKKYEIDGNSYFYMFHNKDNTVSGGESGSNRYFDGNPLFINTYASYREYIDRMGLLLANPLKIAFTSKIKTVKFDGIDCYSIEVKDYLETGDIVTMYFEKATGLVRKVDDDEYYYSFNTVDDGVFELPRRSI